MNQEYLERELDRFQRALANLEADDDTYKGFEEKRERRRRFLKDKIQPLEIQLRRFDTQKAADKVVDFEVVEADRS